MGMENQRRIHRGRRKENAPPRFSSYMKSEQRNVQKNVNINLFLDTGSQVTVSHRRHDPATAVSNPNGATMRGGPCATFIGNRGVRSRGRLLVQSNLPCSDWPFQNITGSFFNSSSRQQSNLESKLQRCGAENVTRSCDPYPLSTVDFGPRHSCLDRVTLKESPPNVVSRSRRYRSQKPAGGFGISHPGSDLCKRKPGNKDRHVLNPSLGHPSVSERSSGNLRATADFFSSTKSPAIPSSGSLLHDHLPSPKRSSQEVDFFAFGPPLTLDHLNSSISDESGVSSATFQALLRSSQTSADLHSSIQQFKKEEAQMGALGSFPWESKTAPLPYQSCFDPGVTTSTMLGAPDDSYARQASVKWRTSFAGDWGLRSSVDALEGANSIPPSTGLRAPPVEALDQFWPTAALTSLDSTPLAFQAKEDSSHPSFCYLGYRSGFQKVPEGKDSCHLLRSNYHQKTLNPEDHPSKLFSCPKLGNMDFPLGLTSFDGLEVSLERLCAPPKISVNKGVTMYNTQRDDHLTLGLPKGPRITPAHDFGTSFEATEPQNEPVGIGGTPIMAYAVDDCTPFLPLYKPSPFRIIARNQEQPRTSDGTGDAGLAIVEKSPRGSQQSTCEDNNQRAESSRGDLEESAKFPHLEKQHHVEDDRPTEKLERNHESMDEQKIRSGSQQQDPLLQKCFGAWSNHILEKKAAAQALYERQLLRKGLGALKWALQLKDVEEDIARRSHAMAVLATSFHRWKAMAADRWKEQGVPQEAMTQSQGVLPSPGKERGWKCPVWCQLSAEQLKGAAQYSRAEGNLWVQLHRTQGMAVLCAKVQAVRDVRRLAAAFRLWRLQKERQEKVEAHLQEALANLEKKRLRGAFRAWRSRIHASRQILLLETQVQRGLISRCFNAWKSITEREAHSRQYLEHQRARSMGQCLRQWALMAKSRERARKSLLELFALKWRKSYGPNASTTDTCSSAAKWCQRNGADALEGLYHALRLQAAFQIWTMRWQEHQQANAFRLVLEQRRLRDDLRWWHWKALHLSNRAGIPKDLTEDTLLPLPDLEESSLSSGFHSNAPAVPVSGGMFVKETSPGSGSQTSISSLATIEDSGHLPQNNSPSLGRSPDPEDFVVASTELRIQASSPLRTCYAGENGFLIDDVQSLGFLGSTNRIPFLVVSSTGERTLFRSKKSELLARCFEMWSALTRQNLKAKQHHSQTLLARFFIPWAVAAAHAMAEHVALVPFEHIRQQRLLASCFDKWKAELARVVQQPRKGDQQRRSTGQGATWWRRRKATWKCRARRMDSVERACNYWTRAAAFDLCFRQQSSLIGVRMLAKMRRSSWTVAQRHRAKRLQPSLALDSRLMCTSSSVWLMIYRSQRRTREPLGQQPPENWHVAGSAARPALNSEINVAADYKRWLGRKYLRRWRDHVRLRRFQDAWKMRRLARAWLLWKDACRTVLGVEELARHRLVQWSWQTWRRRCLQSWVAEQFLEVASRRLLERVFGRWQRQAVLRTEARVNS